MINQKTATKVRQFTKSAIAVGVGAFMLTACQSTTEAHQEIANVQDRVDERRAQLSANHHGGVVYEQRAYYGDEVRVSNSEVAGPALPRSLEGDRSLNLSINSPTNIQSLAQIISSQTDIPVNVRQRYVLPDGSQIEVPISGLIRISHIGPLSELLDAIAARLDVGWAYDGNSITFERMTTAYYKLPIPTSATEYSSSIAGVSAASGGSSREVELGKTIEQNPWTDLEQLLNPLVPDPAYALFSPNSGRVTIFAPPSIQSRAKVVIDDFINTYSTRIGLEVAVFFVDVDKLDSFGAGLNIGANGISTAGLSGGLRITSGVTAADIRALSTNGAVVDYRLGSTVAQSGVVSPIVLTRSQNYVSGSTSTVDANGNVVTNLTVDTIDTGISIHTLPRLINRDQVHLSLTLLQNELVELTSFGGPESQVQLPVVDQRALQNDSTLRPGETLILSGYEREVSRSTFSGGVGDATGSEADVRGLGIQNSGGVSKVRMVVFVHPTIVRNVRG